MVAALFRVHGANDRVFKQWLRCVLGKELYGKFSCLISKLVAEMHFATGTGNFEAGLTITSHHHRHKLFP